MFSCSAFSSLNIIDLYYIYMLNKKTKYLEIIFVNKNSLVSVCECQCSSVSSLICFLLHFSSSFSGFGELVFGPFPAYSTPNTFWLPG